MCDSHESCYKGYVIKGEFFVNGVIDRERECLPETSWAGDGAILVIEDCEPLLFYLNSALLTLGYEEQHLAANLAEADAVWALHKDEIRKIILNYELPDGIGLDFAARVLHDKPEVNIIVTTGYDLASVKEASENLKSLQFLQKPFRLGELQEALTMPTVA